MPDAFYIRVRGRVSGPFGQDELRAMARRGQFGRLHEVSADGTKWERATSYPDLFETPLAAQPSALAATPNETQGAAQGGGANSAAAQPAVYQAVDMVPARLRGSKEWYYAKGGVQKGPIGGEELFALMQSGRIAPDDLVWASGMADWSPASTLAPAAPKPTIANNVAPTAAPMAVPYDKPGASSSPSSAPRICGLAVASLICGVTWGAWAGSILSVVFGILSLRRINASGGQLRGAGLAISGLIVGPIVAIAAVILIFVVQWPADGEPANASASSAARTSEPKKREGGISSESLNLTTALVAVQWEWSTAPAGAQEGSGTAFVTQRVGDRIRLHTNAHVLGLQWELIDGENGAAPTVRPRISGAGELTNFTVAVKLSNGTQRPALRIAREARSGGIDLAQLEIDAEGLVEGRDYLSVSVVDGIVPKAGDNVVAIGNPLGISNARTYGRIGDLPEVAGCRWIWHDAALNPGNSGGPLFLEKDARGPLYWVGVNTSTWADVDWKNGSIERRPAQGLHQSIDARDAVVVPYKWVDASPAGVKELLAELYGIQIQAAGAATP